MGKLAPARRIHPFLAFVGFLLGVFVALLSYGGVLDTPETHEFIWLQPAPPSPSSPVGTTDGGTKESLNPKDHKKDAPRPKRPGASTLAIGSTGADVLLVQERLYQLGYLTQKGQGHFDEATRLAVMTFQKAEGLHPDGVVGPNTYAALGLRYDTD